MTELVLNCKFKNGLYPLLTLKKLVYIGFLINIYIYTYPLLNKMPDKKDYFDRIDYVCNTFIILFLYKTFILLIYYISGHFRFKFY